MLEHRLADLSAPQLALLLVPLTAHASVSPKVQESADARVCTLGRRKAYLLLLASMLEQMSVQELWVRTFRPHLQFSCSQLHHYPST